MFKKLDFSVLKQFAKDAPCTTIEIFHIYLTTDYSQSLRLEEHAGPFSDEWVKDMRLKKKLIDKLGPTVLFCQKEKEKL